MTQRILIISDDGTRDELREALNARGSTVTMAADAADGYQQLVKTKFNLVIINLARAISGADLIKRIRSNPGLNQLKVLTIAEWGTGQATVALSQGADGFEPKSVTPGQLADTVARLLTPPLVRTARAAADGEAID